MRGRHDPQATMLAFVDLEERVPQDHPIRTIKIIADEALERLSPEFDQMYAKVGRASVPPERLLKASLLISLYSVRSERAFCEELEYNLDSLVKTRFEEVPAISHICALPYVGVVYGTETVYCTPARVRLF